MISISLAPPAQQVNAHGDTNAYDINKRSVGEGTNGEEEAEEEEEANRTDVTVIVSGSREEKSYSRIKVCPYHLVHSVP